MAERLKGIAFRDGDNFAEDGSEPSWVFVVTDDPPEGGEHRATLTLDATPEPPEQTEGAADPDDLDAHTDACLWQPFERRWVCSPNCAAPEQTEGGDPLDRAAIEWLDRAAIVLPGDRPVIDRIRARLSAPTASPGRIDGNGRDLLRTWLRIYGERDAEDRANALADELEPHIVAEAPTARRVSRERLDSLADWLTTWAQDCLGAPHEDEADEAARVIVGEVLGIEIEDEDGGER